MTVLSLLRAVTACPFHRDCGGVHPCSVTRAAMREINTWAPDESALRSVRARNKTKKTPRMISRNSRPFGKTRVA